jgi:hypothetical protein
MIHIPMIFDFSKIRAIQYSKYLAATLTFLLSQNAFCYDFKYRGLYFNKTGTNTCAVTYDSSNKYTFSSISIPYIAYYDKEYYVTSIGVSAFSNCENIIEVTLPSTVEVININAFSKCYNLTNINLGNSVTKICSCAFEYCTSLPNLTIGENVTALGEQVFYKCSNLKWIELKSETPPTINRYTFEYCSPIIIAPNSQYNNETYWKNQKIAAPYNPEGIVFEDNGIKYEIISVPEQTCRVYGYTNTSSIKEIPSDVIFNNRKFMVTEIGGLLAKHINSISSFVIPSSMTTMPTVTVFDSAISNLVVESSGNGNIDSQYSIFSSNINKAQLGRNVNIFNNSTIDSLSITKDVTSFAYTLSDNSISNLVIEDADASIKFTKTPLACSDLNSIYIGRNISSNNSFKNQSDLKVLTLGEKVTAVENGSFEGCDNIETITSLSTTPPVLNCTFSNSVYLNATIKVPAAALSTYQQADGWKYFWNIEPIEDTSSVDSITVGDNDCSAVIEYFTLQGVKVIGKPAPGLYIRKQGSKIDKITVQ